MALFIGTFDLTLYSAITEYWGTDGTTVFIATVLSSLPSFAAFVALKEGPLRKYSSLKQFDKLVFSDSIWLVSGLLFFGLAAINLMSQGTNLLGTTVVLVMQVVVGIVMFLQPILRRHVSSPVTIAYSS
jgi:drug/metabolite transporter (DMT)-like permease